MINGILLKRILISFVLVLPVTAFGADLDPLVKSQLATKGKADIFVQMSSSAKLAKAEGMADIKSRRQFVYEGLKAHADASQQGVRSLLESKGLEYKVFWVNNSLFIRDASPALVNALAKNANVALIRGNHIIPLEPPVATAPLGNETDAIEWNISLINADQVWAQGNMGEGIVVANIDTGVRYTHEAVVNNYRGNLGGGVFDHDYNWFDPANVCGGGGAGIPCDNDNHGTHTMGTMVGGDGPGPMTNDIGVAPGAQWMACKGCESSSCSDFSLIACAQFIAAPTMRNGTNPDPTMAPDVVNNSWGSFFGGDPWYASYVQSWLLAGIMPVFSNGNNGPGCGTAGSPGDYPFVIGVGATNINDQLVSFSSRGPGGFGGNLKPHISAPGSSVRSSIATSDTSYASFSGTSMAAPHVASVYALMRSKDATYGLLQYANVMFLTANRTLGTPIGGSLSCSGRLWNQYPSYHYGFGRLDALGAVNAVPAPN